MRSFCPLIRTWVQSRLPSIHRSNCYRSTNALRSYSSTLQNTPSSTSKRPLIACKLDSRFLVRLEGPDTFDYLQGLITNDVHHLQEHPAIYCLLLNHQGRVLYDAILYNPNSDHEVWLECDSSVKDAVIKYLKFFRVRKKVNITDGSELNLNIWAAFEPLQVAHEVDEDLIKRELAAAPVSEHHSSKREVLAPEIEGITDPRVRELGWRILAPSEQQEKFGGRFQLESEEEYRNLRYFLGVGEGAVDLPTANCFPLESNGDYLHGISFQKGCYIGQELTARTHHTGVVRKRLMPFRISLEDSDALAGKSDLKIIKGVKTVGKVRGVCGTHGLALTRVGEVSEDLVLEGHHVEVTKPSWWPVSAPKEPQLTHKL